MHLKRGLTTTEVLTVIAMAVILIALVLPSLGGSRRGSHNFMRNSSQLRGIHQSAVVFSASNKSYLPGLDSKGNPIDSTDAAFSDLNGKSTGTPGLGGGAMNTRLYILLNGNFIAGDLILNPLDTASNGGKWTNSASLPAVPTSTSAGQFSYSLLNIADSATSGTVATTRSPGRIGEWRDNANSQAILICDRNSAANTFSPRSIWATSGGTSTNWKGHIVWGDNHAEFVISSGGLITKYLESTNTNDSLFHDGNDETPGEKRDNAFFNYTSANY